MRLDKYLVECGIGSRSEVKKYIASKLIKINGEISNNPKKNIDPENSEVFFKDQKLIYKEYRYYILYKVSGYITALEDRREKTVMDLLPEWVNKKDLFPIGRLDKDTEGVLLFTNDGKFSHKILSPKYHVEKCYRVVLKKDISCEDIENLKKGVDIGGYITKEAKVEVVNTKEILLTIIEGKFHQVKKMLQAVNNEVVYLKRERFGKITLGDMKPGEVLEIEKGDIDE